MNLLIETTRKPTRMPAGAEVARSAGFTLIEVMMTVAIIGILAAIALPSYRDFLTRGRIPDATSQLTAKRVQMEQYFQDNRFYPNATTAPCVSDGNSSKFFVFSCSVPGTVSVFTLQAVGRGPMAGFTYTIDQSGSMTTGAVPTGWALPSPNTCWVTKKGGIC